MTEFKPLTAEQIEALQEYSDEVFAGLSEAERNSVVDYTGEYFVEINDALWTGGDIDEPRIQGYMDAIDLAMKKFDLKEDIVVYRYTEAQYYADWDVGAIKPFDGYMSTSVTKAGALEFESNGFGVEINVPKGTPGLYIGNHSHHKYETEFLLARGIKFKVLERSANFLKLEVFRE